MSSTHTMDWKDNPLFKGFSQEQLTQLSSVHTTKTLKAQECLIQEGSMGEEFYLITRGTLGIYKDNASFKLAELHPGGEVGLMALLDNKPRSASVIAECETEVVIFKLSDIKALPLNHNNELFNLMLLNHVHKEQDNLRNTNETTVNALKRELEASKLRNTFALVFTGIIFIVTLYTVCMRILVSLPELSNVTTPVTSAMLVVFSIIAFITVKRTPVPLSYFGLTMKNWKAHCIQSLKWTAVFLIIITLGKWILINTVTSMKNEPLLSFIEFHRAGSLGLSLLLVGIYSILTFAQEFLTRGAIQAPLMSFLTGRYATHLAIVLTTAIFASTHLHLPSLGFAAFVVLPSLFWGYLYAQQKSLVGVTLSHILIGVWAAFIMGFPGA